MRPFSYLILLLVILPASWGAQVTVAGKIVDREGAPVSSAAVYLKDSYDGTSSSADGTFSFKTDLDGKQVITVELSGFKSIEAPLELTTDLLNLNYVLYKDEKIKTIETVSIVAGSFDASDAKKSIALKPMDIVTTPSAGGDIYGALSTLPGTQTVGETGKLFVRGGEDYEARTFIDGIQVESPYQQRPGGIPTKGRFSPLLFSGTLFSTGGYSAEYGQALSSVVLLKTDAAPASDKLNINLYSLGLGVSGTKKMEKSAYIAAFDYTDLGPYFKVVPQTTDWQKAPKTISGSLNIINNTGKGGLSKTLISYNDDRSSMYYPYYGYSKPNVLLSLTNRNLFIKNSFRTRLSEKTVLNTGIGFGIDKNDLELDSLAIKDELFSGQVKINLAHTISQKIKLNYGGDFFVKNFNERIIIDGTLQNLKFNDLQTAFFTETEYNISEKWALRLGLRGENTTIGDHFRLMPRASAAYRLSEYSQLSAAYGIFYQNPQFQYLKFTDQLIPEKASHFILNYQYKNKGRLLRLEAFYKEYKNLITYKVENFPDPSNYENNGYGYAKGIDFFYRDSESIKDGDFWFSYSYLDTKKLYRDYILYTTPIFFSKHNFSFVYKQWISQIKSFLGMSYTYASGRPYFDPNQPADRFLSDRTKPYHNVSINYSYDMSAITKIPVTVYASVSNIFGSQNVFGYNNAYNTTTKKYDLIPIVSQANIFYLLALFINL
ncbi:TonB-dependent receptor [Chryseobacterium sp. MYb264]|uniref:TonB-dependent receptor n=1 Tax=Chryseobacterium sp. MYb264 TaxID=2745153 RepID=UPI002E116495|nr:TonB-dependent receptor [Chryseobacterium sp. MYb264]